GGVGVTVRRTCAEPVAPSESVTEAVRTWVPSESVTVRVPPPPSAPSRLDAHWILLVTLPSKSSVAVAPSITVLPAGAEAPSAGPASVIVSLWKRTAPSAGELIVTLGGLPATVTTSFGAGPPSRER